MTELGLVSCDLDEVVASPSARVDMRLKGAGRAEFEASLGGPMVPKRQISRPCSSSQRAVAAV